MAYDEVLAERIRDLLAPRDAVTERKMFGGIGFMVGGNMACGVSSTSELIVRLDPEEYEQAVAEPGVRPFELTGRSMKGWILVDGDAVAGDEELAGWVDAGADFAASLPPK
jgi:TfoX/Sxy family transcriptional regulator of competence genes